LERLRRRVEELTLELHHQKRLVGMYLQRGCPLGRDGVVSRLSLFFSPSGRCEPIVSLGCLGSIRRSRATESGELARGTIASPPWAPLLTSMGPSLPTHSTTTSKIKNVFPSKRTANFKVPRTNSLERENHRAKRKLD